MERGSQVWQHKSLPGERNFLAFTFQLLLTWSVSFYAPPVCWVVGTFHNCPQELAGQLSSLCWRRRRLGGVEILLSYLAVDLEQQLTCAWHRTEHSESPYLLEIHLNCSCFVVLQCWKKLWEFWCLGAQAQLLTWEFLGHLPRAVCAGEAGQRCRPMGTRCFHSCFPRVTKRMFGFCPRKCGNFWRIRSCISFKEVE